ncbi:hypothetical protein BH10ACT3_BH10ACT3_10760 [soil metagenome]
MAVVGSLVLLGAACGSDDAAEDTTTPTAGGSDDGGGGDVDEVAFCDSYVAIAGVIAAAFAGGDTSEIPERTATLEENAPEEISDDVAVAADSANALAEDPEAEVPEGGDEAQQVVLDWVSDNCGFETMSVKAMNYHYMGIPDTTDAATYVVDLTNEGTELHEMQVARVNDDVTETAEELLALPEEEATSKVRIIGGAFAMPGETGTATLDLSEPGRYIALCFIPGGLTPEVAAAAESGGAPPDGAPHFTAGMVHEFTVT